MIKILSRIIIALNTIERKGCHVVTVKKRVGVYDD